MSRTSRFPGFYKLSVSERRELAANALGLGESEITRAVATGGMDVATADKTIENVLGTFALPFALALNIRVNGRDYLAPMVIEEASVVAAASNAARMIRDSGGFSADADDPVMECQIQLDEVPDTTGATARLLAAKEELLALARDASAGVVARGGGPRDLVVRDLGDGMLVVHVLVDCRDAMGANLVNTVAEAVAPRVAELAGGKIGLRILSNLCDKRLVRVRSELPPSALAFDEYPGELVRDGIVRASRFAEKDPYRAATHNKGVMNGVDAVVLATGNDWRAAEAGAHAYAARNGRYEPLCTWHKNDVGNLVGTLEMPLALGIVGGGARAHHGVQLALKTAGAASAQELAMLVAAVGMASNLAALRALATDGIQRGHMLLHARSIAAAVGATGDLVETIAAEIHADGNVTMDGARAALAKHVGAAEKPANDTVRAE